MDRLVVAVIGRTSGLNGYLRVLSHSGEYGHLRNLHEVTLVREGERKTALIEELTLTEGGALVKFEGVDSPEQARFFTSWEIEVPREQACPLHEGEYYMSDLCQCSVMYQGESVGTVTAVCETGAADLLEILTADGRTVLVPFVGKMVGAVDTAGRTIELLDRSLLE